MSKESALSKSGAKFDEKFSSKRVNKMIVSPIKEMELIAAKYSDKLSLGQGTPSFPTPQHIKDFAAKKIAEDKVGKYVLGTGIPELRNEIAKKLENFNHIKANPEKEVLVTVGANEGLASIMLSFFNPGDEILVPSPNYSPHLEQLALAEAKINFVPLLEEENYRLDVDKFRKSIGKKTKGMLLCTPLNPTGTIFLEKDLRELANIALENDLLVITDETYEYFLFDGLKHFSIASIPEMKENVISCFSFSKTYAMTGWRLGYVVAGEQYINQLLKVHDAFAICAPVVSQYAALAGLQGPQDCIQEFKKEFEKRRNIIMKRINENKLFSAQKPNGAYYVFPKILDGKINSFDFCLKLLNETHVVTVPGKAFGPTGEGHVRMAFCMAEETINSAFDRIDKFANNFLKEMHG